MTDYLGMEIAEGLQGRNFTLPDEYDEQQQMLEEVMTIWDYTQDSIEDCPAMGEDWSDCPHMAPQNIFKIRACGLFHLNGDMYCKETARRVAPLLESYLAGVPLDDIIA